MDSLQDTIDQIVELNRIRNDYLNEERSLTLRLRAITRQVAGGKGKPADDLYAALLKGNAPVPVQARCRGLLEARDIITAQKKEAERPMLRLAKELPCYDWMLEQHGFGALGFAQIVAECGDLSRYYSVKCLYKRMGVGLVDGQRQRKVKDAALAKRMGYNPRRRSMLHNIGESIVKAGGPWREVYDERKAYVVARCAEKGVEVIEAARLRAELKRRGAAVPPEGAKIPLALVEEHGLRSAKHVHVDAMRRMEKRLLSALFEQWKLEVKDPARGTRAC